MRFIVFKLVGGKIQEIGEKPETVRAFFKNFKNR